MVNQKKKFQMMSSFIEAYSDKPIHAMEMNMQMMLKAKNNGPWV